MLLRSTRRELTAREIAAALEDHDVSSSVIGQVLRRLREDGRVAKAQYADPNTGWTTTTWLLPGWESEPEE